MPGEIRLAEAKALLTRLIAFDSVSDTSNLPLVDFVEGYLPEHGLESRRAPNAAGDKAAILATIGPRGVIVGGPTMMKVADAHKSVATFRTLVTGPEAHSALPALGANAVAAAADVVSEIGRLARAYEEGPLDPRFTPPYSTLHVGMIRGGTARNILARGSAFNWEVRGLPPRTPTPAPLKVLTFLPHS